MGHGLPPVLRHIFPTRVTISTTQSVAIEMAVEITQHAVDVKENGKPIQVTVLHEYFDLSYPPEPRLDDKNFAYVKFVLC